jgi:hypothetical protein
MADASGEALAAWRSREARSFWLVTGADPETTFLLLRDHLAPCRMWCAFCPRGLEPDRAPAVDDPLVHAAIRAEFAELVASVGTRSLYLVSSDILEYPDLFSLLDVAREAGKRVLLGTPGLALADAAFVARCAAYDLAFDLTFLSTEDETYARITRNPDARGLIEQGIRNARALEVELTLAVVVLAENVGELDRLVAHLATSLGAEKVQLRLFFPDIASAPESYYDQFPSLEALRAALATLDALAITPAPLIELGNTPICQIDPALFPRLRLRLLEHHDHQNVFKGEVVSACGSCEARSRCVRLHPEQVARVGIGPIEAGLIRANLERLDLEAERARAEPTGIPPELGVPVGAGVPREAGVPKGSGLPPGQGLARGAGLPPGSGVAKGAGIPKGQGVPRGQGILPAEGSEP